MTTGKMQPVLDSVIEVIRESLYLPHQRITADTHFADDLGFDSLDLVTVFLDMEADFGVEFPEDAPSRFVRVGDIARFLKPQALTIQPASRERSDGESSLLAA